MPYRYSFEPGKTAAFAAMEEVGSKKPGNPWRTLFYTHGWMTASIFDQVISRTLAAKKELTGPNMKAALESIRMGHRRDLRRAGVVRRPTPSRWAGSISMTGKSMEPNSDWITIG